MDNHIPPLGPNVPTEFISQLSAQTAPPIKGGGRLGDECEDVALAADPSALGALTLLLQQIELHKLDTVMCPHILAHAKRIHDGGFRTVLRDDTAKQVTYCDQQISNLTAEHDKITGHERWEEKRQLARRIKGYQDTKQVVLDLSQ